MRCSVVTSAAVMTLAVSAVKADGQLRITTSADVVSAYHDRGLTLTRGPAIQPGAALTRERGAVGAALSAWSNIEQNGRVTELDLGLELTQRVRTVQLTAGLHEILAPQPEPGTSAPAVRELLFSAAFAVPLSPSLTLIPDIADTGGAYLEGALAWTSNGERPVVVQASLGSSWGQSEDGDVAYSYTRNGLTHAALTASFPQTIGALHITPRLSAVRGIDPATDRLKLFAGVGVSWTR